MITPINMQPGMNRRIMAQELLRIERERQITDEGYDPDHDRKYECEELARAAMCYAKPEFLRYKNEEAKTPIGWPWGEEYWKPTPEDRVRELVKAGALILAAIEQELHKKAGKELQERSKNGN